MQTQHIIQQMPGLFMVMNLQSQFIGSNTYTAKLLGFKDCDEMAGKTAYDIRCTAVESASDFIRQDQEVLQTQQELSMLDIHTYHPNATKILITKKRPFYKNNQLLGVLCHASEIQTKTITKLIKLLTHSDQRYFGANVADRSYQIGYLQESSNLSQREMNCLFYIIRGKSTADIAEQLGISINTVASYIKRIGIKWHCQNRTEIIQYAIENDFHKYIPEFYLTQNISKHL